MLKQELQDSDDTFIQNAQNKPLYEHHQITIKRDINENNKHYKSSINKDTSKTSHNYQQKSYHVNNTPSDQIEQQIVTLLNLSLITPQQLISNSYKEQLFQQIDDILKEIFQKFSEPLTFNNMLTKILKLIVEHSQYTLTVYLRSQVIILLFTQIAKNENIVKQIYETQESFIKQFRIILNKEVIKPIVDQMINNINNDVNVNQNIDAFDKLILLISLMLKNQEYVNNIIILETYFNLNYFILSNIKKFSFQQKNLSSLNQQQIENKMSSEIKCINWKQQKVYISISKYFKATMKELKIDKSENKTYQLLNIIVEICENTFGFLKNFEFQFESAQQNKTEEINDINKILQENKQIKKFGVQNQFEVTEIMQQIQIDNNINSLYQKIFEETNIEKIIKMLENKENYQIFLLNIQQLFKQSQLQIILMIYCCVCNNFLEQYKPNTEKGKLEVVKRLLKDITFSIYQICIKDEVLHQYTFLFIKNQIIQLRDFILTNQYIYYIQYMVLSIIVSLSKESYNQTLNLLVRHQLITKQQELQFIQNINQNNFHLIKLSLQQMQQCNNLFKQNYYDTQFVQKHQLIIQQFKYAADATEQNEANQYMNIFEINNFFYIMKHFENIQKKQLENKLTMNIQALFQNQVIQLGYLCQIFTELGNNYLQNDNQFLELKDQKIFKSKVYNLIVLIQNVNISQNLELIKYAESYNPKCLVDCLLFLHNNNELSPQRLIVILYAFLNEKKVDAPQLKEVIVQNMCLGYQFLGEILRRTCW